MDGSLLGKSVFQFIRRENPFVVLLGKRRPMRWMAMEAETFPADLLHGEFFELEKWDRIRDISNEIVD